MSRSPRPSNSGIARVRSQSNCRQVRSKNSSIATWQSLQRTSRAKPKMMRLMTGAFGNGEWRTWVLAFDHPDQRSLNSFAKGMTGQHRRHGLTHLRADQAGPDSAWDGGHLGRWPSPSTQSRPLGARKGRSPPDGRVRAVGRAAAFAASDFAGAAARPGARTLACSRARCRSSPVRVALLAGEAAAGSSSRPNTRAGCQSGGRRR